MKTDFRKATGWSKLWLACAQNAGACGRTGPRAVLGSQRVRLHNDPGTDSSVLSSSWPLRAEDGSRSGRVQMRRVAAFSLIEVLCAILILGVAMAGLTRGITTALSSTKESELQTTAALIAAGLVESLRTEGGLLDGETEGSFGGGLTLYRWKETVTASRIDGLHEVKVVIENAKSGQTIYELETLLFEPTADTKPAKEKDKKAKKRGGSRG